jgi:aspartyl-tRNA(Asn)/glutamyl-tRNA(Gln) amidotransferase subunit A
MARASRARRLLCERFAAVLEGVDLIASAATCIPAFPIEARMIRLRDNRADQEIEHPAAPLLVRLTSPSNLTGLPAISVPAGFTADGLPIGLQLQARPFEEATLLDAASAYEQHARWFERRPDLLQTVSQGALQVD